MQQSDVQPDIMRHRNLRWCKPPGNMPGSRHYRLLGFAPRLPEVHTFSAIALRITDRLRQWRRKADRILANRQRLKFATGPDCAGRGCPCEALAAADWATAGSRPPRGVAISFRRARRFAGRSIQ